jgi:hypothetical protein
MNSVKVNEEITLVEHSEKHTDAIIHLLENLIGATIHGKEAQKEQARKNLKSYIQPLLCIKKEGE